MLTTTYLISRTPTPVLNHKSPYEVLHGAIQDHSNLRVLGCLCHAKVVPQPSDKFSSRLIKGVFMGYPYAKNGYKILNLGTNQVFVSGDALFVELIFPFKDIDTAAPQSLFPPSSLFVDTEPLHFSAEESTPDTTATMYKDEDETVSPHDPVSISIDRPQRNRKLPAKFSDYVGLPPSLQVQ